MKIQIRTLISLTSIAIIIAGAVFLNDKTVCAGNREPSFVYTVEDDPQASPLANPTGVPKLPTGIPALPTGFPALPTGFPALPTRAVGPTATPKPDVSIVLDKTEATVVCGNTFKLKATVTGSDSKVLWLSSNPLIASVDTTGVVRGRRAGQVTITAIAGLKTAACKVTVLYQDVTDSKAFWYTPTNYLTAKGVVRGYDDQTSFKPSNNCTRAQMVTFIWRLAGQPLPKTTENKFKDVRLTDYYYLPCLWGSEKHIVEGYSDGTFRPDVVCARRHAVTFLWRYAGKPVSSSPVNKFSDVKKDDYFYNATLWASEKKILVGYEDGTFRPDADCLRRQMVTFLYKYDKSSNK